jgi:hypothetical protein
LLINQASSSSFDLFGGGFPAVRSLVSWSLARCIPVSSSRDLLTNGIRVVEGLQLLKVASFSLYKSLLSVPAGDSCGRMSFLSFGFKRGDVFSASVAFE